MVTMRMIEEEMHQLYEGVGGQCTAPGPHGDNTIYMDNPQSNDLIRIDGPRSCFIFPVQQ